MNDEVFLGSIQCSIVSMGSAFAGLSSYRGHRFKQVLSDKYSSILQNPVTSSRLSFSDNLPEKLKKISEEQKLIKKASSVLGKNMSNNNNGNFRIRSHSSQNKLEWSQKGYTQEQVPKKCQLPNQIKYKQKKENP